MKRYYMVDDTTTQGLQETTLEHVIEEIKKNNLELLEKRVSALENPDHVRDQIEKARRAIDRYRRLIYSAYDILDVDGPNTTTVKDILYNALYGGGT